MTEFIAGNTSHRLGFGLAKSFGGDRIHRHSEQTLCNIKRCNNDIRITHFSVEDIERAVRNPGALHIGSGVIRLAQRIVNPGLAPTLGISASLC